MRLGLIVLLCLVNAGCAIVRRDAEEPVDNTHPKAKAKAEPELKPSEVLQPKSLRIASPITDHFYLRGTFFPASVTTDLRLDPNANLAGTPLSGEDDLGLDDQVDQGRMAGLGVALRLLDRVRGLEEEITRLRALLPRG